MKLSTLYSFDLTSALTRLLPLVACGFALMLGLELGTGAWESVLLPFLLIPALILLLAPGSAVLIWLLFFPYFVRKALFAGEVFYWGLHRMMIGGALVIVLLQLLAGNRRKVSWKAGELVMLLFLVLIIGNILFLGPTPQQSLIRFYDRLLVPFAMYFLIRILAPGESDLKKFVPIALITITLQAGIGILSWFAPAMLPSQWRGFSGERVVGTFSNAATYTSTLIFLSMFLLNYATTRKRGAFEQLCLLGVGVTFLCVFLSFSRGSWLGGAFVVVGLSLMYPKLAFRSGIVVAILLLVAGTTLLSSELSWASERLQHVDSAENRIVGAVASLRMFAEKPWFGWGYDSYNLYKTDFKAPVGDIPVRGDTTSHNTYLTILVEDGVFALILYVVPIGILFVRSLKVWRSLPTEAFLGKKWLVLLWLYVLDHFVVSNFMDMIRYNIFGTTVLWLALGLIASLVYRRSPRAASSY